MSPARVIAVAVACLLAGTLAGYLLWGWPGGNTAAELASLRASVAAEAEQRGRLEDQLKQAEARVKQMAEDLESERQQRARLESLVSQRRK